jgi:hypothetical protein
MRNSSVDNELDRVSFAPDEEFHGDLTEQLRARVKGELEPGERLLWAARSLGEPFALGTAFLIVAGVAVVLLAIATWLIAFPSAWGHFDADRATKGFVCGAFGLVLTLGLLANLFSRRVARSRMTRVCYALTDRRAIIWVPEPRSDATRVYTILRGRIKSLVRVERPDGTGDLEFSVTDSFPDFHWYPLAFKRVADVRRVEQIVRNNLIRADGGA